MFEQDRDTYLVRAPDGYTNVVWKEDGKVVRPSEFIQHGWDD